MKKFFHIYNQHIKFKNMQKVRWAWLKFFGVGVAQIFWSGRVFLNIGGALF
jgi:hypothetical protein